MAAAAQMGPGRKGPAYTRAGFQDLTFWYFMKYTGIPINFGITVVLGVMILQLATEVVAGHESTRILARLACFVRARRGRARE